MNRDPALLLLDGYKLGHIRQYPAGTQYVYSNLTARRPMDSSSDGVIFFGLQFFLQKLQATFRDRFFDVDGAEVLSAYKRRIDSYLGPGHSDNLDHVAALHELGHLPLRIKALPEGTLVPYGVPMLTIENTKPEFFWLTNAIETLMSSVLWKACTSATSALNFRRTFEHYSRQTVGDSDPHLRWQGHDFSFRGMSGPEDAALSGAAHLLSFTGTDTIPAIDLIERYYRGDATKQLIGGSVPATEHSVMCAGGFEDERETFRRLITEVYPRGIVSIVSDTWDFWKVLTEILPSLKSEIMARDGKVVIRPDSGDPAKIVNGDPTGGSPSERVGALMILLSTFGGSKNANGYMELDPHIGLIYGDSITPARQEQILAGMKKNGFASNNIVLGIGSYNYQYTTRDVHGFAIKATHVVHATKGNVPIYKCPATDTGAKKSARGLLRVDYENGRHVLKENVTRAEEQGGELMTVYENGFAVPLDDFESIRERVRGYFHAKR